MEEQIIVKKSKKKLLIRLGVVAVVIGLIATYITIQVLASRTYIEKAEIGAPIIVLSPAEASTLDELMVHAGDHVDENEVVARVGDELIKAKSSGLVVNVSNNLGKIVNPGEAVVTMINPDDLRVIGHLDENKGLESIRIGQRVIFNVDAFGSKQYVGVVDEISDTSRSSDLVFSISDKREAKVFDIKIRFNLAAYPELKNGMSASAWVYKN
jgi:multidrug resistance efflux pump